MQYWLSKFEIGNEPDQFGRLRRVWVYVEYSNGTDTASELHERILYRNADGIAVIESDIYESQDYIDAYKITDREEIRNELEKFDIDEDDLDSIAEYYLFTMLYDIKERAGDEELKRKINEALKSLSISF